MYYDNKGNEITIDQIRTAFADGTLMLVHSNGDGKTLTSVSLDGREIDTRGECHSAWDEVWTQKPKSIHQAIFYSKSR